MLDAEQSWGAAAKLGVKKFNSCDFCLVIYSQTQQSEVDDANILQKHSVQPA